MIILNKDQLREIEEELKLSISEIDLRICSAEQAMRDEIKEMHTEDAPDHIMNLRAHLNDYEAGVRDLRTQLNQLRRKTHELLEPSLGKDRTVEEQKEKAAVELQRETHNTPGSFSDFVKGLLMWKESPEDRMSA